jgi:hypothetical protein
VGRRQGPAGAPPSLGAGQVRLPRVHGGGGGAARWHGRRHREQKALDRIGFTREGVLRAAVFRAGAWRDLVLYALLRERWGSG